MQVESPLRTGCELCMESMIAGDYINSPNSPKSSIAYIEDKC